MSFLHLVWAFFISNLLGYGGGPASIPLYQAEVVDHYKWMNLKEFGDILAIANALPGPISTKLGAYVGYEVGGIGGVALALLATVLPSSLAMILLFKFLNHLKDNPYIQEISKFVLPAIGIMLGILAIQFIVVAFEGSGIWHTLFLFVASFLALQWKKVHPALVIAGTLGYGGIFLA